MLGAVEEYLRFRDLLRLNPVIGPQLASERQYQIANVAAGHRAQLQLQPQPHEPGSLTFGLEAFGKIRHCSTNRGPVSGSSPSRPFTSVTRAASRSFNIRFSASFP
jgi:hypothetical protein